MRQGDEWILNGEKCFIANGCVAKLFLISTRTNPDVPQKEGGTVFLVPVGTPQPIINRLYTDISAIVKVPAVRERFVALGADPVGSTPQEYGAFLRNEVAKWARVVKESGAHID